MDSFGAQKKKKKKKKKQKQKMADTRDTVNVNVNVSTQTYSGERATNTSTGSTYGAYAYEDDDNKVSEPEPTLRKAHVDSSTDGVAGYRYKYSPMECSTAVPIEGGQGYRVSNPLTGAYDEEVQYRTTGALRYHWERVTPQGSFFLRDVDVFDNGTKSVHREYSDPTTGKNYLHEYQC